jgi:hypothetical protein
VFRYSNLAQKSNILGVLLTETPRCLGAPRTENVRKRPAWIKRQCSMDLTKSTREPNGGAYILVPSSGMWRHVVRKSTDVTEEAIVSVFRLERHTRFKEHLSWNVAKLLPTTRRHIPENCKLNIQFNPVITTSVNATSRL